MAQQSVVAEDKVNILSTRVKKSTNELMVKIDKPWEDLSSALKTKLFEAANRIGADNHPTLEEDWTPNFFYKA